MINKKNILYLPKKEFITRLIKRQINVDTTLKQRRNNVDTTSSTLKQHPPNFQIQPNFNVDTTLKIEVESTLIQRCCACWDAYCIPKQLYTFAYCIILFNAIKCPFAPCKSCA